MFLSGWGEFKVGNNKAEIIFLDGNITLKSLKLSFIKEVNKVIINGKSVGLDFQNGIIYFDKITTMDEILVIG